MGLFVGSTPVKQVHVGNTPVTAVFVGSQKVWPTIEVVQITLGSGYQAQDQFQAALTARGLNYQTVTEVPFEIELVGTGATMSMFNGCSSLTSAPEMDTSQVTSMVNMFYDCSALTSVPDMDTAQVADMDGMFSGCSALTSVPDMDTSQVTNMFTMFYDCSALVSVPDLNTANVTDVQWMFYNCSSLTDGNVRLIGRHPDVNTTGMITDSGLTREPFYMPDGTPDDGTITEVHEVTLTNVKGAGTAHPLVSVTVPAGETWTVSVQGTMQTTSQTPTLYPQIRIGASTSAGYSNGATVDFSGTITSSSPTIALVIAAADYIGSSGFTGTVTIEK